MPVIYTFKEASQILGVPFEWLENVDEDSIPGVRAFELNGETWLLEGSINLVASHFEISDVADRLTRFHQEDPLIQCRWRSRESSFFLRRSSHVAADIEKLGVVARYLPRLQICLEGQWFDCAVNSGAYVEQFNSIPEGLLVHVPPTNEPFFATGYFGAIQAVLNRQKCEEQCESARGYTCSPEVILCYAELRDYGAAVAQDEWCAGLSVG